MKCLETWHSVEVQDEGCHERGFEGEDGDDVGEDDAVGVVQADDQMRVRGSRVGKLQNKRKKVNWRRKYMLYFLF